MLKLPSTTPSPCNNSLTGVAAAALSERVSTLCYAEGGNVLRLRRTLAANDFNQPEEEMKQMFLDEKTFERLLDRIEASVRKVLDKQGIKPKTAESKNAGEK